MLQPASVTPSVVHAATLDVRGASSTIRYRPLTTTNNTAFDLLQPREWGTTYRGYMVGPMAGITFFVVSGYVFVGLLGRRLRPRVLFRVKSVALLTTISVPLTIAYDLWTATGEWAFLTRPLGVPLATMLEAQVPFTLYHLLSSLIFVPLLGAAFLFLHAYGWPTRSPEEATSRPLGRG